MKKYWYRVWICLKWGFTPLCQWTVVDFREWFNAIGHIIGGVVVLIAQPVITIFRPFKCVFSALIAPIIYGGKIEEKLTNFPILK